MTSDNSMGQAQELDLSFASIKRHFVAHSGTFQMPYHDDSDLFRELCSRSNKHAAVLIPIMLNTEGETELILTRRADHLRYHAGQISFPGGRLESTDETHAQAALREAWEEVNLPPESVQVIGHLADYFTISGFRVTPVIGLVEQPVSLSADPAEVAEIIHVPLRQLMRPNAFSLKEHSHGEMRRRYYSTYYHQHHIWGVTAGILVGFYQDLLQKQLL